MESTKNSSNQGDITILSNENESIFEKNLVWVFAAPRSGTTWFAVELLSHQTHVMDEPYIGTHLAGPFGLNILGSKKRSSKGRPVVIEEHKNRPDYFFSDNFEKAWKFYMRKFILNRIYFQFKDITKKIIIKEPNGIMGGDTIIECLPKSKIIIMFRDGRDILDSLLDARTSGGWLTDRGPTILQEKRIPFLKLEAKLWVTRMNILKKLKQCHPAELTYSLKYEDLRKNTIVELEKIYKFIEIEILTKTKLKKL